MAWEIWQKRINFKFGKRGTVQRSLHGKLNQEIQAHFEQREHSLIPWDNYLLQKYNVESLYKYSINAKQSWLTVLIAPGGGFHDGRSASSPTSTDPTITPQLIHCLRLNAPKIIPEIIPLMRYLVLSQNYFP